MQAIPVKLTRFWWLPLAVALPILLALYLRKPSEGFSRRQKSKSQSKKSREKKSKSSKSIIKTRSIELSWSGDSDSGSGGGQTKTGTATFYWSNEKELGYGTGPTGACYSNKLKPFYSLAVKCGSQFNKLRGTRVEYKLEGEDKWRQGVIEDACGGSGCRDIDVFVGSNMNPKYNDRRKITYKLLGKDPNNKCTNLDYNVNC
jgi:hypothetical protein